MPEREPPPRGWPDGFGGSHAEREALLVLSHLQGMVPRELHSLAWRTLSASASLRAVKRGAAAPADRAIAASVDPRRVFSTLKEVGARAVTPADGEYPERLLGLPDPPACLFVRGRPLSELGKAVAVVGARSCSPYGRDAAMRLASGLADAGVTVVSGAALGIDGVAHEGALRGGGYTVAVLGSGIDRPHPMTNESLIERVAAEGSVVSEYPPGEQPWPRRFPARNRIIAALSDAVLVVEGAEKSGSLQTAEFAGETLGRDVMAVPGPIDSSLSEAPHGLIRNGAALVGDVDDVLAALGLDPTTPSVAHLGPGGGDQGKVLRILSGRPASLEDVASASAMPTARALVALTALELRGWAEQRGGRYRLAPQPRRDRQTSSRPEKAARTRSAEPA